jgi:iron complex outermembrane recepter protein
LRSAELNALRCDGGAQQISTGQAAVSQSDLELEEVVVTANKREQRLQDVGLAVSAVSGDMIAAQRVEGVADLARVIAGLQSAPSPNDTPDTNGHACIGRTG